MRKILSNKIVVAVASLCLAYSANASVTTSTMTVTGNLSAPVSCTMNAPATVDFGSRTNGVYLEQPFTLTLNCSSGASYSVSAPVNTAVTIGSDTDYLSVLTSSGGANIGSTAYTSTGTGVNQNVTMYMQLHGTTSTNTPVPNTSTGSFSTTVTLTLTY